MNAAGPLMVGKLEGAANGPRRMDGAILVARRRFAAQFDRRISRQPPRPSFIATISDRTSEIFWRRAADLADNRNRPRLEVRRYVDTFGRIDSPRGDRFPPLNSKPDYSKSIWG